MRPWLYALLCVSQCLGEQLGDGKFLVASRKLGDPNFAETVILLVQYDAKGAMGLVINNPSKITIAEALAEIKGAKGRQEAVFLGGPVGRTGLQALLRSKTAPDEARLVFGDVYATGSRALVERTLGTAGSAFRVYLGYAGWGSGQLERELALGAWHVLGPNAAFVFDAEPETVWQRLIRRTELQFAAAESYCRWPRANSRVSPVTQPVSSGVNTAGRAMSSGFPMRPGEFALQPSCESRSRPSAPNEGVRFPTFRD